MGEVEATLREHYSMVWRYGAELDRSNPMSAINISVEGTTDGKHPFMRFLCVLKATEGDA